jgi:hypothetical protein
MSHVGWALNLYGHLSGTCVAISDSAPAVQNPLLGWILTQPASLSQVARFDAVTTTTLMFARMLLASGSLVNAHLMPLHIIGGIPTHTACTCLPRLQTLGVASNNWLVGRLSGNAAAVPGRLLHVVRSLHLAHNRTNASLKACALNLHGWSCYCRNLHGGSMSIQQCEQHCAVWLSKRQQQMQHQPCCQRRH